MRAAYELEGVVFGYGADPVVSVRKMAVAQGEFVALVGPNGAGKTTLLALLGFLERPWEGEIRFFGEQTRGKKAVELRRRIGFLLQNPYLFNSTVLENIAWGLRVRGVGRRRSENRAREALEAVGLAGFEKRRARLLSGGEAQRVALARALAPDPEVLLLDEPGAGMDEASARRMEQDIRDFHLRRGRTLILSTHNLSSWGAKPDRVIRVPAETRQ